MVAVAVLTAGGVQSDLSKADQFGQASTGNAFLGILHCEILQSLLQLAASFTGFYLLK